MILARTAFSPSPVLELLAAIDIEPRKLQAAAAELTERRRVVPVTTAGYRRCMRRRLLLPYLAALLVVSGSAAARDGFSPSPVLELLAATDIEPRKLQAAAAELTPARIRAAVEAGPAVDTRGPGGLTPLLLAAYFNADPQVVQALVDAGADVAA